MTLLAQRVLFFLFFPILLVKISPTRYFFWGGWGSSLLITLWILELGLHITWIIKNMEIKKSCLHCTKACLDLSLCLSICWINIRTDLRCTCNNDRVLSLQGGILSSLWRYRDLWVTWVSQQRIPYCKWKCLFYTYSTCYLRAIVLG